jgi:hypothetical protein
LRAADHASDDRTGAGIPRGSSDDSTGCRTFGPGVIVLLLLRLRLLHLWLLFSLRLLALRLLLGRLRRRLCLRRRLRRHLTRHGERHYKRHDFRRISHLALLSGSRRDVTVR